MITFQTVKLISFEICILQHISYIGIFQSSQTVKFSTSPITSPLILIDLLVPSSSWYLTPKIYSIYSVLFPLILKGYFKDLTTLIQPFINFFLDNYKITCRSTSTIKRIPVYPYSRIPVLPSTYFYWDANVD